MFKQIVKTLMKPFGNSFAYGIILLSLPASKMTSFFNKMSFFVEILLHYSSGLLQAMNHI